MQPLPDGYFLDIVDNKWREEKLPFDQVLVPAHKLTDPEGDGNDCHLTLSEQVRRQNSDSAKYISILLLVLIFFSKSFFVFSPLFLLETRNKRFRLLSSCNVLNLSDLVTAFYYRQPPEFRSTYTCLLRLIVIIHRLFFAN